MTSEKHLEDLTGKRFGKLTVVRRDENNYVSPQGFISPKWICECDCGNVVSVNGKCLRNGSTRSCGCVRRVDLTGRRFGKLVVIEPAPDHIDKRGKPVTRWLCKCDCGNTKIIRSSSLIGGGAKSCGCGPASLGEQEVRDYLDSISIKYNTEHSFPDLVYINRLRFDFAILDANNNVLGLVEYQGPQHYKPGWFGWGDQQRLITDQMKRDYCKAKGIPLLEIRYRSDVPSQINSFIQSIMPSHVNLVPSLGDEEGVTTISQEST